MDRMSALKAQLAAAHPLVAATQAARQATGKRYGTQVKQGRFQVVICTPRKGKADLVEPQSGWLSHDEAVAFLNALRA